MSESASKIYFEGDSDIKVNRERFIFMSSRSKSRLGKLRLPFALEDISRLLNKLDFEILSIDERHVLALVEPEPPTRDPFDRLLLAQCQVENLRLVTVDRALTGHRLSALG